MVACMQISCTREAAADAIIEDVMHAVKSLNMVLSYSGDIWSYGSTHSNSKHEPEAAEHQDVGMMEAASLWLAFLICVIMLCVRRWSPQMMLWLWPRTYNFSICFSRMVHHGSISYMHACIKVPS